MTTYLTADDVIYLCRLHGRRVKLLGLQRPVATQPPKETHDDRPQKAKRKPVGASNG